MRPMAERGSKIEGRISQPAKNGQTGSREPGNAYQD
jgi:hypothetical protein